MRKFLPLLLSSIFPLILLSSIFHPPSSTLAQTSAERALSDYQFQYGKYRNAHSEYLLARNRYLAAKTLTSKQEAFQKTKAMLLLRAETLTTYFIALEARLAQAGPADETTRAALARLSGEGNFIANHKASLETTTTLEEVVSAAQELDSRKERIQAASYQMLSSIALTEQSNLTNEIELRLSEALEIVNRMEKEGEDVGILRTWVNQIRSEVDRAKQKQTDARAFVKSFEEEREDAESLYRKAKTALEAGNTSLNNSASFLFELLREIKE